MKATPTRNVGKPDPNPGYQRTPAQVVRTESGREVVILDGTVLVDLKRDYERAGLSWPEPRR